MTMPVILLKHPRGIDAVGIIPQMLNEDDPAKATVQLDTGYKHGGGWHPFTGFTLNADDSLTYPGDPSYKPLAEMRLRDERILVYDHGWVAVIQPDRSHEICRMD